jgi:hypothetical protein
MLRTRCNGEFQTDDSRESKQMMLLASVATSVLSHGALASLISVMSMPDDGPSSEIPTYATT